MGPICPVDIPALLLRRTTTIYLIATCGGNLYIGMEFLLVSRPPLTGIPA